MCHEIDVEMLPDYFCLLSPFCEPPPSAKPEGHCRAREVPVGDDAARDPSERDPLVLPTESHLAFPGAVQEAKLATPPLALGR